MASTRRQMPVVQIFNDPAPEPMALLPPSQLHAASAALQSVQNIPALSPPLQPASASPRKQQHPPSSSPQRPVSSGHLNIVKIPPPDADPLFTDHLEKKPAFSTFNTQIPHKSNKPLFSTFPTARPVGKENVYAPAIYSDAYPDPTYGYKAPLKRTMSDSAPLRERPANKKPRTDETHSTLPNPDDLPTIHDDGKKPNFSYAMLIGMAILRAPNRRLTLAQIYKWISDNFAHYRSSEAGWQNSIRHNLSLNKAFIKQERPKDDPGKGNYWAIESGQESTFLKDKPVRKAPMNHTFAPQNQHTGPPPPSRRAVTFTEPISTVGIEPSSDATIPASDLNGDGEDDGRPRSAGANSSPPAGLHSSPPIIRHGTPPLGSFIPSSSNHMRSKKRKSIAMDSGYYSSLECSSVARPNGQAVTLSSEADLDRPRVKRGRAEEEIARIRHSSHDISPTKTRPMIKAPYIHVQSSSPLRQQGDHSQMLPPLTPACTFKIPAKPPQSVSPNTNLRNHRDQIRELVGSPEKSMGVLQDEIPWSPAFNLGDDYDVFGHSMDHFNANFDIFSDGFLDSVGSVATGSPMARRSAKRPRLDRASTMLADVTGMYKNGSGSNFSTPLKASFLNLPAFSDSPLKASPSKLSNDIGLFHEDLFDDCDDLEGLGNDVDITQGFEKIGGGNGQAPGQASSQPAGGLGRPSLARSMTSRF